MEGLDTRPQQEANVFTTIDTSVLSMTQVWQRLQDDSKTSGAEHRPTTGSIVPFIARIRQSFNEVEKTSVPLLEVFSNVADLASTVRIQKVAFENCSKLLLIGAANSPQDFDNMIDDSDHPVWEDATVYRRLDKVMTRFNHIGLKALEHLHESLAELKVGLQILRGQAKQDTQKYQLRLDRSYPVTVLENLPDIVQNLKDYNDIFCILVWQAVPRRTDSLLESSFATELGYPHAIGATPTSHPHLGCIQRVLQVLFDTLRDAWTCRDHKVHYLSISMKFDHARAGAKVRGNGFRFNLAVTSPYLKNPYQIVVDTSNGDFSTCQTIQNAFLSKEAYLGNKSSEATAQSSSSAHSNLQARTQWTETPMRSGSTRNIVPELGFEEDMCLHIRTSSAIIDPHNGTEACPLGYLESRNGLKFLLASTSKCERQNSLHSLEEVLVRTYREGRAIPLEERLRTASLLAAGILYLNTSSWLPPVWSSKDICFLNVDDYEKCALGEPFLQIPLFNNANRSSLDDEGRESTAICSSLLSLGLVLIELAHSAPWEKLQIQEDLTEKLSIGERNLLNLMRLSKTVSRQLGSRYAKVVQTCLSLGLETQRTQDLEKAELDEIISEEVVNQLDQCLSIVTF
ncbi:hypothetical protein BDR22DRAFT_818581 [Usnea florida]